MLYMNKYIVGSILGVISLLVIFGASASNRVARWVDSEETTATRVSATNATGATSSLRSEADRGSSTKLISLNQTGTATQTNTNLTPMQKAGELPQRQTVIDANRTTELRTTAAPATTQPTQPTTATQPNTTANQGVTSQPETTTAQSRPAAVPALW
jgi:hypothetical protein